MTSLSPENFQDDPVTRHAVEFFVDLQCEDVSVHRVAEWQKWLSESAIHREAFERVEEMWDAMGKTADVPWPSATACGDDRYDGSVSVAAWRQSGHAGQAPRQGVAESGTRRRLQIAGFVAACSLVLLAMVGWLQLGRSESPGSLVIETNVGESREVALSDGSQVSVSGRTLLWVTFGPNSRSVKLERGEAFFHVAKDSRRPFTVRSNNTAVTAVGTAFDVREAAGRVVIGVAEGVVKVETATAPPETGISAPPIIRLASVVAGQQLTVEQTGSVKSAQRIDPHTVADWRDGRLWYLDEPLESVVSDLNRFAPRNIRIADPAVGRLRVTGTVLAGSEDSWLRSLETSLPVVIVRDTDGAVVIEARK